MFRVKKSVCSLLDLSIDAVLNRLDLMESLSYIPKHLIYRLLEKCCYRRNHTHILRTLVTMWPFETLPFKEMQCPVNSSDANMLAEAIEGNNLGNCKVVCLPDINIFPFLKLSTTKYRDDSKKKGKPRSGKKLFQLRRAKLARNEQCSIAIAPIEVIICLDLSSEMSTALIDMFRRQLTREGHEKYIDVTVWGLSVYVDHDTLWQFLDVFNGSRLEYLDMTKLEGRRLVEKSAEHHILRRIATWTSLKTLMFGRTLSCPEFDSEISIILQSLHLLEHLHICAVSVPASLECFFSGGISSKKLCKLELVRVKLNSNVLKLLAQEKNLENLEFLNLRLNKDLPGLCSELVDTLQTWSSCLTHLNLSDCMFRFDHMTVLCDGLIKMSHLQELYICQGNEVSAQNHIKPLLQSIKGLTCLE